MAHISTSHGTHINARKSHGKSRDMTRVTHERVILCHESRLMSHGHRGVMAHILMSHVAHMNESWHTYE